jgi:hypothetical protein
MTNAVEKAGARLQTIITGICNEITALKGEQVPFIAGVYPDTILEANLLYGEMKQIEGKSDIDILDGKRWVELKVNTEDVGLEISFLYGGDDQECESIALIDTDSEESTIKAASSFVFSYLEYGVTPSSGLMAPSGTMLQ